jgi:predicted anti-sigma-YlaC factor YlaD
MMNCKRAEQLTAAKASGTISSADAGLLENHLEACAECKAIYERQMEIEKLVAHESSTVPTNGFAKRTATMAANLYPRKQRLTLREVLSLFEPVSTIGLGTALTVGGVWLMLGDDFIKWLYKSLNFREMIEGVSVAGYITVLTISVTITCLIAAGLYKAVRDS